MIKALHKSIALVMAVVVLFSTMSFTVDMHYCGDTLVEASVFKKPQGCGMEMPMASTDKDAITKKSCCKDEQQHLSGQDELPLTVEKFNISPELVAAVFLQTYTHLFEITEEQTPSVKQYQPPNSVKQLFKLDESYLI